MSAAAMGQRPLTACQCPCQQASKCQGEDGARATLLGLPPCRPSPPALAWFPSKEETQTYTQTAPVPNFLLGGACAHTHTCRCSSNPPKRRLPVASKPQFLPWRRCSLDLWWGVRSKGRYERVVGTGNLASYPSSAPSKLGDLEQVIKLSDAIPPLLNGVPGTSLVVQ